MNDIKIKPLVWLAEFPDRDFASRANTPFGTYHVIDQCGYGRTRNRRYLMRTPRCEEYWFPTFEEAKLEAQNHYEYWVKSALICEGNSDDKA